MLLKLVNFTMCGQQISCSTYFRQINYKNITGLSYQISHNFNLSIGLNNIRFNKSASYKQGSMVLLEILTGIVSMSNQSTTAVNNMDYMIYGNENQNFDLVKFSESVANMYVQLVVITQRFYYENNQIVSKQMNTEGYFNLNVSIYDEISKRVYLQRNFELIGKIYKFTYYKHIKIYSSVHKC